MNESANGLIETINQKINKLFNELNISSVSLANYVVYEVN